MRACSSRAGRAQRSAEVQPGLPSPFKSELSGEGLRSCDLGGAASFTINAQDEFGNACQELRLTLAIGAPCANRRDSWKRLIPSLLFAG